MANLEPNPQAKLLDQAVKEMLAILKSRTSNKRKVTQIKAIAKDVLHELERYDPEP